MRYKPRCSLLTLLILTAIIAGGVKLWHGPHHVVERSQLQNSIWENEYTFTRSWDGTKLAHGAQAIRVYTMEGTLDQMTVTYVRHGTATPWYELKRVDATDSTARNPPTDHWEVVRSLMTREEYDELRQMLLSELRRDPGSGMKWKTQLNVPSLNNRLFD